MTWLRGFAGASIRCSLFVIILFILFPSSFILTVWAQNVGIGTPTPGPSALLQLETTSKGLLTPRMTDVQMLAISTPATGDLVFNTTYTNFYYYDGAIWTTLGGSGWSLIGDANTNSSTNFLGTIDAQDIIQKTDKNERLRFFSGGNVGLTNVTGVAEALRFYQPSGSGSLYTGFKAGVQTATAHYILPLSDGTANQALVTDGAGNLSWHTFATFGGGGSDPEWARGSGTYAEYSLGTGNKTSGKYAIAGGDNDVASGQNSVCFGDNGKTSGSSATIVGGSNNDASGGNSNIRGGAWNSSSSSGGYIGGGLVNSVSGQSATVVGGDSNSISGQEAVIINGANNQVASQNDLVFGSGAHPTGPNQLIFYCPTPPATKLGMNTYSPAEAADVVGNIRFSGSLKPNGAAGSIGQCLLSAGSGSPPTWGSITIPTTNWSLTGSAGTNPATNFIGTTDASDFVVRTNAVERTRITSSGFVGVGTSSPVHQLASLLTSIADETAAIYGTASGATASQSIGVWESASNSGSSNTGTIALLGTGNSNSSSGTTNIALQISQGEFAMGRGTQSSSAGTVVEGASAGTSFSAAGPSGVIQLSLITDLTSAAPSSGVYQDLGTVTINNRYITTNSIILANVVSKIDGGSSPSPKNSIYHIDVESRSAGSCVLRISMIPFVTDPGTYQGSDYIRIAYAVINPGR